MNANPQQAPGQRGRPSSHPEGCTLVLGWPDPVARGLVARLIEQGRGVALLVPEGGLEAAEGPALARLAHKGPRTFEGDPTAIDFGLTGSEYVELVQLVDRVLYAVRPASGVKSVEDSPAVRCATELCELARAGGGASGIVFLSSLLALGSPERTVLEGELEIGQSFASSYEESLAVAEKVARRAGAYAPLSIVRAAPIIGDATTGELYPDAPLARLVRRLQVSALSSEIAYRDEPVRLETTDRVVEAMLRLHDLPRSGTFHLVDRAPLTDRILIDTLIEHLVRSGVRKRAGPGAGGPFKTRLSLPDVVGSQAVLGWRSRFDAAEADRTFGDLLERDPRTLLATFFPDRVGGASGPEGQA